MVVTTGQQLNGTWLTWKAFHYPHGTESTWAYAVPTQAANQINSAYSLMIDILIGQICANIFGLFIVTFMWKTGNKAVPTCFPDLLPYLWNSQSDLLGAFWDKVGELCHCESKTWRKNAPADNGLENNAPANNASADNGSDNKAGRFPLSVTLAIILALFAGQKATSIIVSAKIIIGNVAPVNPDAIYVPRISSQDNNSTVDARYVLDVPWALRALGTATASIASLSKNVNVSQEILVGTFNGSQVPVYQITYSYRVTGADMGLQKHPELALSVKGSCFTEYNWYSGYTCLDPDVCVLADVYNMFDDSNHLIYTSALNGAAPMAFFQAGEYGLPGNLSGSNSTWAAIISSVGKLSYTSGTDPWYLTEQLDANSSASTGTGANYSVAHGRPALSCWEDDVWSYKGHKANINNLDSLPGLGLSLGMLNILGHYLSVPMVVGMSVRLGTSALISASLGSIIDASASSFAQDLERLVVAAYVATTNVLTTTTLYPDGASTKVLNDVRNTSGLVEAGVADFVVWTPDASALNLAIIIAIPILVIFLFLLDCILFKVTPMVKADAMGAVQLFSEFVIPYEEATVEYSCESGLEWKVSKSPGAQDESQDGNQGGSNTSGTKSVS